MAINGDDIMFPYNEYDYDGSVSVDGEHVALISRLDLSYPLHLHLNDSASFTVISVELKGYCVALIYVHKVAKDNKMMIDFDEHQCYLLKQDLKMEKI
ncbi:hypothetical protein Tco_0886408 [Tanacetum coccineum]